MSLQNSVCAHRTWCVQPPPWWRWRQRPTKRIWQGGELFLAARRPRRMRKVIACSASFSFSLLLVSSSIVLDEDRPPQRDRCASAAAPPLLRLAAPLSPHARLACPFLGCLSTPRLVSSCVCVWPAAAWPLGGLPSAVCGCSNATADGGTADRAGLAARTLHPPIPIGAKNCVLPCAG
jgi:hypothetical protein